MKCFGCQLIKNRLLLLLFALAAGRVCSAASSASYTGTFAADDDQRTFYFALNTPGTVTVLTWSYAGGVNSAGATIPEGGFDPTVSVFDSNGNLIGSNRDGGCGTVPPDSVTGFCWDSYLSLPLPAGNYSVVLTESENVPNGPTLAQSFAYDPSLCPASSPLICPTNAAGDFTAAPGNATPGFWDASPNQRTANFALDILGTNSTAPATITISGALPGGGVGANYGFRFTAQATQAGALTWAVVAGNLPPGLTLSASGFLSGMPSASGNYAFSVQVYENGVAASQPQPVALTIYTQLILTSSALPSGTVGQAYSAGLGASGGSGNYVWSAALPAGLLLSPAGAISGTPTATFNGSVAVTVTDPATGITISSSLPLTISALPIVLSGRTNLGDVPVNGAVAASYSATGGVPPYTWSLGGAPGLSIDSNGNVGGVASQAGNFTPAVSLTDKNNTSASLSLTLAVLGINGSFPQGTTTSTYSGGVNGVGGTPPYTYALSGLPQGLTVSGGSVSGQISTAGSYTVGARVTDANGVSVSQNFSFVITGVAPSTLTIVTTGLPDGVVGQPYGQTLGASGGKPGYTWSQSGGQAPAGLSLSGAGTVSGTPTTPGTYAIGVQVTDTAGAQQVGAVSIKIDPSPLQITSGAAFPNGLTGVDYPGQILSASGGVPPYTFSVQGSLPAGMTLTNGQLGGTPSTAGTFNFNLVATDSATVPNTATVGAALTVGPNKPSLVLSAATASFSIASGATALPSPITIPVSSSVVSQILTFTASSSAPWLTAGGSSSTPGSLALEPNSGALALNAAGSPYSGSVTVTCTELVCAGDKQTIAVTLTVTSPPPRLSVGAPLVSFTALTTNPQSSSAALNIQNAGGGSLKIQSVSAADGWISVGAYPSAIAPGPGVPVAITVNPAGLSAGYYLSAVTVVSSAGTATVPVTLLLASAGVMTLGPEGTQFSMPQGGAPGNAFGSFLVSVSSGSVGFNASVVAGGWLTGGGSGTATPSQPGTVSFAIDPAAAAALSVGAYYGTIRVSSSGVVDSPQDFQVVLVVTPATTPVVPDPEPAGQLFISSGSTLPPETIQVYASSTTPIIFQAAASTIDGAGWLSVSPATGTTSAASPAQLSVTVNTAKLTPGVYRGSVSFSFGASAVRSTNITLIVESAASGSAAVTSRGSKPHSDSTCASPQLVPTQTGLVSNFSAPASWPVPLAITLADSCGNTIANGQVVATFSNGDPPLILSPVDPSNGLYSATWTPRGTASQVTVLATTSAQGYTTATTQIAGQVAPNTVPVLAANGTLDVFHPQVGAGFGPGNIVQIYGSGLAGQPTAPNVLPLPTQVNGTSVIIGGIQAPIYYVSPGQINAQIPFELNSGNQYQVIVNANGALTTPQAIQLTTAVPAILQFNSGEVVAQHQDGTLLDDSDPAVPGEYVTIYLTGLGATDIPVPSGSPSPANPAANVLDTPVLTLNNNPVPVIFAGLTPGDVGLYQIDFQVPQPLADGNYSLFITQSGTMSNTTVLPVMNPVAPH